VAQNENVVFNTPWHLVLAMARNAHSAWSKRLRHNPQPPERPSSARRPAPTASKKCADFAASEHGRYTFASRLVMEGVNLKTVQGTDGAQNDRHNRPLRSPRAGYLESELETLVVRRQRKGHKMDKSKVQSRFTLVPIWSPVLLAAKACRRMLLIKNGESS
jgi:hypothetical protein